jgi:hypothetical protein
VLGITSNEPAANSRGHRDPPGADNPCEFGGSLPTPVPTGGPKSGGDRVFSSDPLPDWLRAGPLKVKASKFDSVEFHEYASHNSITSSGSESFITGVGLHTQNHDAHSVFAVQCLRVMNQQLRQNICQIEDPSLLNLQVDDLPHRRDIKVSDELRYACLHWVEHITRAQLFVYAIFDQLKAFCEEHILHWIEMLSLLGRMDSAAEALLQAMQWSKV